MVDRVSRLDLTFIVQNTYISQPKFIKIIKRFKTGLDNAHLDHFSGKRIYNGFKDQTKFKKERHHAQIIY
jgi:hypothetical protein